MRTKLWGGPRGRIYGGWGSIALLIFAGAAFGQANAGANVCGNWVNTSDSAKKLTVAEKGDTIHVEEMSGSRVVLDYTCPLNGQECEAKENGRPLKVMTYLNGPNLVELQERGSEVEKRRFVPGTDGKKMQLEVIPLSSSEKTETVAFERESSADSEKN